MVKIKSEIEIVRDNLLYEKEQHQIELKKQHQQISENSNEIIELRDEVASLTQDKEQLTINSQQLKSSHQEIITNICLSLELPAKATQADILALIASLMKRPNVEVVSQKDQVISDYSERLATSENLRKEAVNSLTLLNSKVQTTQTNLAISVSLGSLTVGFLLIYLILLRRKCSTLKRIRG